MSPAPRAGPRVAAISGASSGIGRALAHALAARGAAVAIGARGEERLAAVAGEIRAAGGTTFARRLDVGDAASVDAFFGAAGAALGPADLVISCAAHARPAALVERAAPEIEAEIRTDLLGALLFARGGLRAMAATGGRRVVLVSSEAAATPWPGLVVYAACKAALEQGARSLAAELEGRGVAVTVARVGNTAGTAWTASWTPEELAHVASWARRGLVAGELLTPAEVAHGLLAALDETRQQDGFQLVALGSARGAARDPG